MRGLTVVLALVFGLVAGGLIGKVALAPQAPAPMVEEVAPAAGGGFGAPINWKLASSLVSTTPIVGPAIEAFIEFALSPVGQRIGEELGFLPVGPTE